MELSVLVFLGSLALAAYFLAGYPLWLRFFPYRSCAVGKDAGHTPSVTVLLAVHNGEEFLKAKIENLLTLDYPQDRLRIVVISDGSTDETEAIARSFKARGVDLVTVPRGGKAAALNAGLTRAVGELIFFCDVRQRIDPLALRHLAANFADPRVGAVTGELRILKPDGAVGEQADMDLYWRYELWVRARHSAIWSLFNTTGCLYAMRRGLCRPLPPHTLGDDAVLPLGAYLQGLRIVFDPQAVAYDYATQSGTDWKRRMRTLSGMWQTYRIYPRLLLPHRMWLHFFAHKLGRLLLPWALLTAVVASLFLPESPWKWAILAGEAAFFTAALLDPALPRAFPLKRVASLCRTFLVMNVAAFLSVKVFFVSPLSMWGTTKVDRAADAPPLD
ncbi:MAG: glycosyltransferase family 2 protein [Bryobacterales bacterium]|nr:glycosyltransferase family 2 protein [Bryobacterales bacterium]